MADDAFAATVDPRQAPSGDALAATPPRRSADALDADFDRNIAERRQLMQQQQKTAEQKEAALAPLRAQQLKTAQQPIPQPPQAQKLPDAPQRNNPAADEQWLSIAMVLGAIGGGLTRNHTTNALAAMTGAIEGYNEGSRQKFDQNLKIWDAESKKILETNKAASDRYQQILQNNKLALEQKSMEIQLVAAKYDDRAAMQMVQQGQLDKLGDLIQRRSQFQMQLSQHEDALRNQHAQWFQREQQLAIGRARQEEQARHNQAIEGGGAATAEDTALIDAIGTYKEPPKGGRYGLPIMQAVHAKYPDYDSTKYTGENSYQRLSGGMGARVEMATNEVDKLMPLALDASKNLPRGQFVPLNKLLQMGQAATSNPQYNDFLVKNQSLARAYGRAMNPQGIPRVSEMQEARAIGLLSMATSRQAYEVQVKALKQEVDASRAAVAQARSGKSGATPAPGNSGNLLDTVRSKLPQGWTAEPVQ